MEKIFTLDKKKILVIRLSSIGDIVLTTPVLRCIKKTYPTAIIHYATKKAYASIITSNPYIDRVIAMQDYIEEIINVAKYENYTHIIDLHHNLRTATIKRALKKIPAFSFHKLNIQKWLLTALKVNYMPPLHIVDRYMETLQRFGVTNDGQGLDYFIPTANKVTETDIPTVHLAGYIGIVIGAAHATKQLPVTMLQQLCAAINHPIMLLGGPNDAENGKLIAAQDTVKIYNACGKFNLNESADLIRRSKFIITHDTGLMHIAAAFKKPIISIWGNTVPAFGMTPYYGHYQVQSAIIENKNIQCRPCSKIGYDACPKGHFKCMQQLNIATIAATALQFLRST